MTGRRSSTTSVVGGGSGGSGVTPEWVEGNYISKNFFNQLFTIHGTRTYIDEETEQEVTEEVTITPNTIADGEEYKLSNVEVSIGLWTQQFLSALGLNPGGGGGTVTSVGLSVPTGFTVNNSPITSAGTIQLGFATGYSLPTNAKQSNWDTAYGWGNHANAGYATQSWVTQQGYITSAALNGYLPLSGGTMTGNLHLGSSAGASPFIYFGDSSYVYIGEDADDHLTIRGSKGINFIVGSGYNVTINSANIATQSWVQQQGYLTQHQSLAGYATQSWVQQQGYLTSHQSVDGTFWGQSWTNHGTVSGNMTNVGNITSNTNGIINNFSAIELIPASGAVNGGAIYFHYNGATEYASVYISENNKGILSVQGHGTTGLIIGDADNDYIQIGDARLVWDSANNALKVVKADGSAVNFYATGGVSALGYSS